MHDFKVGQRVRVRASSPSSTREQTASVVDLRDGALAVGIVVDDQSFARGVWWMRPDELEPI